MIYLKWLAAAASAVFFIASAQAQNAGTVTNHATAIGKGAGVQGFASAGPCGAGIALVGNASADPSCQTLPVVGGGTGLATLAIGDLLQASSSSALARLAAVATGNVLLSGGVGVVSTWGKVGLTTHVSGLLPLANGGTNSDLSATGGTSQFLRQNTVGGAIAPIRPVCADLSNATSYCSAAVGQLPGETSTGSATAGNVGEIIQSNIPVGSAVSLTSTTPANITSISLTAGDWDVSLNASINPGATTSVTAILASISQTSATRDTTTGGAASDQRFAAVVPASPMNTVVGPLRISLASPTTIYAVVQSNFTVSTNAAYGIIRARRVR